MENDPSKKESKGKRILKKAIRRTSKGGSSQSSEQGLGVSRSKSFETKRASSEGKEGKEGPLPAEGQGGERGEADDQRAPHDDAQAKKFVDIQESRNEIFGEAATASRKDAKLKPDNKDDRLSEANGSKKSLKRKLEEESGAGTSGTSTGTSDTDADDKDPSKDKKKKNRCAVCRKKVGLTGFECRCGGLFCAVHRYSDKHDCSFDYRELGAQEIRRNNPVVVSQKIHKI